MKIIHKKGENIITFLPGGTLFPKKNIESDIRKPFFSKVKSYLKLAHLKLYLFTNSFEIHSYRSKKKYKTFVPTLLNETKPLNDVLFIYKFRKPPEKMVSKNINDPGNYAYRTMFFKDYAPNVKMTMENIFLESANFLIEHYYEMQISISESSIFYPLYSITLKFI